MKKKKQASVSPAPSHAPQSAKDKAAPSLPGGEETEPTASRTGVPVFFIVILGLLLYWGDMYVMENGADVMGKTGTFPSQVYFPLRTYQEVVNMNPKSEGAVVFARGQRLYKQFCSPCHQDDGRGNASTFVPPLAGSEWVMAEGPNRIIRIVLNGLQGPITVNGKEYGGAAMLPWRDSIPDDKDVAAILTYIRQDWGNKMSEVTPEQVKAIREETKDKGGNWTAPELLAIPAK